MSLNRYSVETPEVAFLKKDLDGLNDVYRDIADEIGVENAYVENHPEPGKSSFYY